MQKDKRLQSSNSQSAAARHLASLVRDARLARRWTQAELAERARLGVATIKRIESGSPAPSLSSWLAAMEAVGALPLLKAIENPATEALLRDTQRKRSRHAEQDLDF